MYPLVSGILARMIRRTARMSIAPSFLNSTWPPGAITIVNGAARFHFSPHAACSVARSAEANCLFGLDACCFLRNSRTAAEAAGGSVLIVRRSKARCRYIRYVVWRSGEARVQSAQGVEQKRT